ncbi:MAG: TIM barrel protein [Desulfobacteraceae bacterium]|nr:TIM barrel protein [Desulfobacteraceae bacterium]
MHPPVSKGAFPFRIGTTSFIYPDDYVPNVRRLAPIVDEIELLFFEGRDMVHLPPKHSIDELVQLGADLDIGYNVHLPADLDLGHADDHLRRSAVHRMKQVLDIVAPLKASTHTLHLMWHPDDISNRGIFARMSRHRESLTRLFDSGVDPKALSIETLDYPFEWVEPVIREWDLPVCLDIGHLIRYQYDMAQLYGRYRDKTAIMHLHGVQNGIDHLGLDQLPDSQWQRVREILSTYTGTVSVEVFAEPALISSLLFLKQRRSEFITEHQEI